MIYNVISDEAGSKEGGRRAEGRRRKVLSLRRRASRDEEEEGQISRNIKIRKKGSVVQISLPLFLISILTTVPFLNGTEESTTSSRT